MKYASTFLHLCIRGGLPRNRFGLRAWHMVRDAGATTHHPHRRVAAGKKHAVRTLHSPLSTRMLIRALRNWPQVASRTFNQRLYIPIVKPKLIATRLSGGKNNAFTRRMISRCQFELASVAYMICRKSQPTRVLLKYFSAVFQLLSKSPPIYQLRQGSFNSSLTRLHTANTRRRSR